MRQRLVLSTVAVALGALLVLGLPLVFFVDRLARAEAAAIVRRQAEGIATGLANEIAAGRIVTADVLADAVPPGDHLVLRTPGGTVVSAGEIRARGVVAVDVSAIGGITLENLDEVLAAGATRVCAVSAILKAADVTRACQRFKERLVSRPLK